MKKIFFLSILFYLHSIFAQSPVSVDQLGDVGKYCSLSFNSSGQPVISYYDATNTSLKKAEFDGTNWSVSTIDNQDDAGSYSSIAITSDGKVNISYYDATQGALKYQGWADYTWTWTPQNVYQIGNVGQYNSLDFDANHQPVISSYDQTNTQLIVSYLNNSTSQWENLSFDNAGDVGQYSSIAIADNGDYNISYYDADQGALKYQGWADYTWTWTPQNVYQIGNVGQYNSLDFDANHQPVISSYDQTNTQLIVSYLNNNTSQWENLSFDNDGDVGQYSSIAVFSNGDYNISYYDADRGALKYQGWADYDWQWQPKTIFSDQNVGQYNSLAFSPGNVPFISYYNSISGDLILGKMDINTQQWSDSTIDESGNVGQYTSIDIDDYGNAGISYYNVSSQDLKYAYDVVWQNNPPFVSNPMNDINQNEDFGYITLEDLDDVFSDPDQQPLQYHVSVSSANLFVSIDAGSHIPTFHTSQNWSGSGTIIFSATDGFPGSTAYDTVAVVINPVNDPPVITNLTNMSFPEDNSLSVNLNNHASDVDNNVSELNWQVSRLNNDPVYFNLNNSTNEITFSAAQNYNSSGTPFRFILSDPQNGRDTANISITVTAVNDPPQWVSAPDTSFNEDGSLFIALSYFKNFVFDPDDDNFNFTFLGNHISSSVKNDTLKLIPAENWWGTELIRIIVADSHNAKDTTNFSVTVKSINDPPVIAGLGNIVFDEDNIFSLNLNNFVSDVDNDTLELIWSVTKLNNDSINFSLNQNTNKITFSAPPNYSCSNTPFRFIVSDPQNGRDTVNITISVIAVNDPPRWLALSDTSFNEDDSLFVSLDYFRSIVFDPDDNIDSLKFSFKGKNILTFLKKDTLKLWATSNWFGIDTLRVIVKDLDNAADTVNWYVQVNNVNDAPKIINLSDFVFSNTSIKEINLREKAIDVDDAVESLVWQIIPDNDSLLVDIQNNKAVFSTITGFMGSVKTEFIVADPHGLSDTTDIFIQVVANENTIGIFLTKSENSGEDWTNPVCVPYSDIFHHAQLTKIDGKMYIYGVSYSQDSVLYMSSADNGNSWTLPQVYVDNLNAYYTSVWLDETGFYILSTGSEIDSVSILLPSGFLTAGKLLKNIAYARHKTSNDILHSPQGNIYITFMNSLFYNRFIISENNGQTWRNINIAGSQLYYPKYSLVDDRFITVSNYFGSTPPYDSYIKYTLDDGLTWNSDWIDISHTSGVTLDRFGQIVKLPDGHFMAMWACNNTGQIEYRISDNIDNWLDSEHDTLAYTSKADFDLTSIENDLYLLFFNNAEVTAIENNIVQKVPDKYQLSQNYPNPFNPTTTIEYGIPYNSKVSVEIYNILGQKVTILEETEKQAGYYKLNWNAANFSSGIYFVHIKCSQLGKGVVFSQIKKMILLK